MNNINKIIAIGLNAGINITTETNMLYLKSKSIDIEEKISDREHYLISKVIDTIIENNNNLYCECNKPKSGNCSTSIGRPALGCSNHNLDINK